MKVAVEYDGAFSHSREGSESRDLLKTKTLLNEGYKVVRIREIPLKKLSLRSKYLYQTSAKALKQDKDSLVKDIINWFNKFNHV